ncbi:hypothetical protein [Vitiosangium sp. GDMCC 1.1324]|uniref:hypothetical protein n=1 Tax=Vitiosangium sp. (strain GDMCC 1.1324) TaxID=2138576 RepID=UPI000D385CF4|nr:hypothetical protein [Vitiosangium sp. GDMCC 1.1324]PTL84648.1 hypothetical protein DAT35_06165 [Vitiosangium sp. GDMCC 1.1324]
MMTSSRARSPRRSLIPPGFFLATAVLLLLEGMAGCARSDTPPPPVEAQVEGYWLRPIPRGSRMVPCGHGSHAWVWTPGRDGLWLVDADGRELLSKSFSDKDKDARVVDVVPTADPERAWVHVQVPSIVDDISEVYGVDHQGREQRLQDPIQQLTLVPSEGHERLWVVSGVNKQLRVFDAAGSEVGRVDPSALSGVIVRKAIPVGDGQQGWLVLDQSLYQVDLRGRSFSSTPQKPSMVRAKDVSSLVPTARPQRAWVLAEQPGTSGSQFVLVGREGAKTTSAPLPGVVQRLIPHGGGSSFWMVVAPTSSPGGAGFSGPSLKLVGVDDGKVVGRGLEVEGKPTLEHSPDGHVWVSDDKRVYLLGDGGDEVARSEEGLALGGARLLPLSAERAWAVTRDNGVHLLSVKGTVITESASLATGLRDATPKAWDAHGGWLLSDDGTRLHRLELGPEGLSLIPVLEGVAMGDVLPIPGTGRFWISGIPRGYVYGPASEVRRVAVGFAGGAGIERDAGGKVQVRGRLEAGAPLESLELDWPGLAQAAGAGRTLRLELRAEDGSGELVGQGLRHLAEPSGLLFQWMAPPGSAEHLYRTVVAHEVENGSRLSATFQHVPFGVPLLDRVWVRTALACLAVTLLLLLPVLLLRPSAAPRRWLPLLGYVASLVGAGGGELMGLLGGLRIHLPTVLAVTCAELVLCAGLGLLSPAVFRRLVFTHPFSWAAAPLLRWPSFRRRFFAAHVRQVRRRVDVASAQANGEVFVELSSNVVEYSGPGVPPSPSERTAEELCLLLTRGRAHLLIQCAGGRGKSALLRQLVRLSLERFEKQPALPLPVFIDPAAEDLETAAKEALQDLGLPEALRDALLESGDFFLVLDGLTESKLEPEALRRYLEREMGLHAPVLLSARPNEAYRAAMSHALRWMGVEPKRLDEAGLVRFQAAYPGPDGKPPVLSESSRRICRGRAADGTYVPILVRLALRFGGSDVDSVINLYRAVFAGLLKKDPDDAATSELLTFAETLCLGSYWEHRSRLIVFRDSPDEPKLRMLLDAGLLVSADARPGPVPTHVRFFHDSMQSYLTARALYARHASQARWDCLWRAAGEPGFAREQSDLMTEAGSELFQMCSYVFGYDARLKAELARHLELCAEANDERLNKEGILAAVPEALRPELRKSGRVLSPGLLLSEASRVCGEYADGEALFLLYARIAPLAWPWKPEGSKETASREGADAA